MAEEEKCEDIKDEINLSVNELLSMNTLLFEKRKEVEEINEEIKEIKGEKEKEELINKKFNILIEIVDKEKELNRKTEEFLSNVENYSSCVLNKLK